MRTFAQQPKAAQQTTSAKTTMPDRARFGSSREVNSILHLPRTVANQAVRRMLETNTENGKGDLTTTKIARFGHDFSRIPIHSFESAARQSKLMVNTPGEIRTQEPDRMARQAMRIPVPLLQRSCACGGDCPRCKGEQGSHERPHARDISADRGGGRMSSSEPALHGVSGIREAVEGGQSLAGLTRSYLGPRFGQASSQIPAYKDDRAIGLLAKQQAAPAFGPRRDGLDDAPYFGPASPANNAQFGLGKGTEMGCVIGPMRVVTSGALEGGYTVNDYLVGLTLGNVGSPGTAGADDTGFKVQLCAAYTGDTSLGVSQTYTFSGANQAFLDSAAQYLGKQPGSVTNGTTINEPLLNAGDHYAHTGWELQYGAKTGDRTPDLVSFADVPRNGPGSKGSVDFRTCFYSRGGPCQEGDACATWRWTIDFTGSNNINTVT